MQLHRQAVQLVQPWIQLNQVQALHSNDALHARINIRVPPGLTEQCLQARSDEAALCPMPLLRFCTEVGSARLSETDQV